jgi:hypothetical protein
VSVPLSADRQDAITVVVFAGLAVLAAAMPVHNDTWWHLRGGLETLSGQSPFVDHFSWTVTGTFFWNHSWLAQVVFYALYHAGGLPLLTALCAAAVVTAWWLVWRQCRGDAVERVLMLAAALTVSTLTWSVRPQVAIVLLPVVVGLVARPRPVAVACVMALWANLHAGFALGVFVLAAGVAAAALFDRSLLRARLVTAAAGTAATLFTPLGLLNWREIGASLARSRANVIVEWQPPGFHGHYLVFWGTALLFLAWVAFRWKRLDSQYARVSALAACLAALSATRAMRNIPAFMMLALPPLSAMLFAPGRARATIEPSAHRGRVRQWAPQGVIVVVALAAIARLWTHPTAAMDWHPISPAAQAAVAACRGPLFNTYGQGGVLIWFVPTQPVFVDSRQDPYPISLVQQAVQVEQTGEYRDVFTAYGIRCAVLPAASPAVAALTRDAWHTRHADGRWVVLEQPH